jgi:hypothetical protein
MPLLNFIETIRYFKFPLVELNVKEPIDLPSYSIDFSSTPEADHVGALHQRDLVVFW